MRWEVASAMHTDSLRTDESTAQCILPLMQSLLIISAMHCVSAATKFVMPQGGKHAYKLWLETTVTAAVLGTKFNGFRIMSPLIASEGSVYVTLLIKTRRHLQTECEESFITEERAHACNSMIT